MSILQCMRWKNRWHKRISYGWYWSPWSYTWTKNGWEPSDHIYNMNIYFKVVEVQIQALECIPKIGRDSSHPGAVLKAPHPIEPVMTSERWTWNTLRERDGSLSRVACDIGIWILIWRKKPGIVVDSCWWWSRQFSASVLTFVEIVLVGEVCRRCCCWNCCRNCQDSRKKYDAIVDGGAVVALRPSGNSQGSWLFMSLQSGRVITRNPPGSRCHKK